MFQRTESDSHHAKQTTASAKTTLTPLDAAGRAERKVRRPDRPADRHLTATRTAFSSDQSASLSIAQVVEPARQATHQFGVRGRPAADARCGAGCRAQWYCLR
jgi:hypothetical protein